MRLTWKSVIVLALGLVAWWAVAKGACWAVQRLM